MMRRAGKPLPYPDADGLVLVGQQNRQDEWDTSVVDCRTVAKQAASFEAVAAMHLMDAVVTDGTEPRLPARRAARVDPVVALRAE